MRPIVGGLFSPLILSSVFFQALVRKFNRRRKPANLRASGILSIGLRLCHIAPLVALAVDIGAIDLLKNDLEMRDDTGGTLGARVDYACEFVLVGAYMRSEHNVAGQGEEAIEDITQEVCERAVVEHCRDWADRGACALDRSIGGHEVLQPGVEQLGKCVDRDD